MIVEFLDGDPDRPLVTDSVYNPAQMPPYTLPANADNDRNEVNGLQKARIVRFRASYLAVISE